MSRVRWHIAARLEFLDAVDFYKSESPGLGDDLVRAVDVALLAVAENPSSGAKTLGETRRKLVRGFPYSLFYRFDDGLYVLAVAHQKRRPGYWADRLGTP